MAKKSAYASAGVDLEVSNRLKDDLPTLLASTKRPEVLGEVGGFGGLFALNTRKYRTPVLVSSVDGVGTKLKVAFAQGFRVHGTHGGAGAAASAAASGPDACNTAIGMALVRASSLARQLAVGGGSFTHHARAAAKSQCAAPTEMRSDH